MKEWIAYCGLDCEACDARLATIQDDDALRERTAALWSRLNGYPITKEMINCTGCRTEGVKTIYCSEICQIRKCARERELPTCGSCPELGACQTLAAITGSNPQALENLK